MPAQLPGPARPLPSEVAPGGAAGAQQQPAAEGEAQETGPDGDLQAQGGENALPPPLPGPGVSLPAHPGTRTFHSRASRRRPPGPPPYLVEWPRVDEQQRRVHTRHVQGESQAAAQAGSGQQGGGRAEQQRQGRHRGAEQEGAEAGAALPAQPPPPRHRRRHHGGPAPPASPGKRPRRSRESPAPRSRGSSGAAPLSRELVPALWEAPGPRLAGLVRVRSRIWFGFEHRDGLGSLTEPVRVRSGLETFSIILSHRPPGTAAVIPKAITQRQVQMLLNTSRHGDSVSSCCLSTRTGTTFADTCSECPLCQPKALAPCPGTAEETSPRLTRTSCQVVYCLISQTGNPFQQEFI